MATQVEPEALRLRWLEGRGPIVRAKVLAMLVPGAKPDWATLLEGMPSRDGIGDNPIDLRGINLSGEALAGVDLTRARLDQARLEGVDLREARLDCATLTSAKLIGARLDRAVLRAANAHGADFGSASLAGADLSAGNFASTSFRMAMLAGARVAGATFADANLRGCDLTGADRTLCDFEGAALAGARRERVRPSRHGLALPLQLAGYPNLGELLRNYLRFLHRPDEQSLLDVEILVEASPAPAWEVLRLFEEHNWRLDLVAATGLVAGAPALPPVLTKAWEALARSWVSPQLAVALSLVDPQFDERARAFIRKRGDADKAMGALEALMAQAPVPPAGGDLAAGSRIAIRWLAALKRNMPGQIQARWVRQP